MAGGKLSPRQKMINMMYLVLTALLALNVSKEVLNSFFEVNLGIVKTTEGIHKKNIDIYFDDMKVKGILRIDSEIEKEYYKILKARIKKAKNPAGIVQHEWF